MRALAAALLLAVGTVYAVDPAEVIQQAQRLESEGDAVAARALLRKASAEEPQSAEAALAYAEFLDRYADPETREAYEKALPLVTGPRHAAAAHRLLLLSLIDDDREAAAKYAKAAGLSWQPHRRDTPQNQPFILIPGPLSSFARMAALSQDQDPHTLLTALARNVITDGYRASQTGESLEPTEYMKLLTRYVSQARELTEFAGDSNEVRIEECESSRTGDLLRILGYRMRGGCGSEVVLETVNASRAFLTIDSGFPLAELEQSLRTNRRFVHPYQPTRVPILYGAGYWYPEKEKQQQFIESFLADPALCRLYIALSNLDEETAAALHTAIPQERLRAFAHVLDFFGGMLQVRGGKATVPGGARSAAAWADLAGASPAQGAAFIDKLISRDDGWLAGYFDAIARADSSVRAYVCEPQRLKRFYAALRGRITSPGPARPVFRSNADLMLFLTRLRIQPGGKPHIPGGLEVWKDLFARSQYRKQDGKVARAAAAWRDPDDLLEALFGQARKMAQNEPLRIFMAASDIDARRTTPLQPATVTRLARDYHTYNAQYIVFNETPALSDETIIAYLDAAAAINEIGGELERADAAATMQALAGLWQIFTRHHEIPEREADSALAAILAPFQKAPKGRDLFDAGRAGVKVLLKATASAADADPQQRIMDLLTGATVPADADEHTLSLQQMVRMFEAQRLVSLDTLFDLADNLESVSRGEQLDAKLAARLASRITELESPRSGLTAAERATFAYGYWSERHMEQQSRLNLQRQIERAGNDAQKLADIRGDLAPVLRDTLVGLNYIHYAPPGAQLIYSSPTFVRGHDFIGIRGVWQTWRKTDVIGVGWPSNGGGRLLGSLSMLPYALAQAEQNFLVPEREQALVWGDLVPQMLITATVPRWWDVTRAQMHWVGLHMRYGESLIAEAAIDAKRREQVLSALEEHVLPGRLARVSRMLEAGDAAGALRTVTPAELFIVARAACASGRPGADPFAARIVAMQRESAGLSYETIAARFGTPKPSLTTSFEPGLLYLRPFPTLMGYSSRILAESWESNTLYWAALADQVHLAPSRLNTMIPEWTRMTVEKIFATHLEDWPAVLRSVRTVGEQERLRLLIGATGQKAEREE